MFGILEAVAVPHHGIYNSFEDLLQELTERVAKEGYKIVKARSHRVRAGGADGGTNEINRCDLVCDRGGRPYKSTATKHKSSTKKTDCPWKAKAVLRKTMGGWVLSILCDQHNHEAGTPEPPTPPELSDQDEGEGDTVAEEGPRPDPDTAVAMQIAGVPDTMLRLTGDTFHQFKRDYRKMSQADRLGTLSQLQLRIAAIYAVQNEEVQRSRRQEATVRRHSEIDAARRQRQQQRRTRWPNHQQSPQQQQQQPQPPQPQSQQQPSQQAGAPQAHVQQQQQSNQVHQQHIQQQFQIHDSPSQQLMSLPGANLALTQQPQYAPPPKRMRTNGSSAAGQQAS